ncbi:MAG: type II secretion system protein [Sulfitobacter sp.]|uniref:type II secretion system protein n=1 Tax=Sulfitobacter sp. TaxID=1903071 RepID=UPI004059F948
MTGIGTAPPRPANRRKDAGMTLVEILVVLAIIGVMASVLGLSVSGGTRSADVLEREATLLSARLERAADSAALNGTPAGFTWDDKSYSFVSLQDGAWAAHPDGILAAPHLLDRAAAISVLGQARGRYLIRSDMLPSVTDPATNSPVPLQIAIVGSKDTWEVRFDGVSARSQQKPDRSQP